MRHALRARLRALFAPAAAERELDEELRLHLERDVERNIAAGMSRDAATRAARRAFGNVPALQEEARDALGTRVVADAVADLRYALRVLRRTPGFTAVAVLSLALGIGANTAIFSLISAVLLRPLPVGHPESLVVLAPVSRDGGIGDFGYADYLTVRDHNHTMSGVLAASNLAGIDVALGTEAAVVQRKIVSATYFSVLGVQAGVGRVFRDEDEDLRVAVISDRFWRRSFGGSASVLEKQLDLDGVPFTIVGVAPSGFFGETVGEAPDVWATMSLMPAARRTAPGFTWLNLMGRLNPGVPAQRAAADVSGLVPEIPSGVPRGGFIRGIAVESGALGGAGLRHTFSAPLAILMAVVAVVLLIACTNLASLLLARATTRRREIATRFALGAGRGRILRQLITESVLLAIAGGALGLLVAAWSERLLLGLVAGAGRTIVLDLRPDWRILLFTAAISVATGLLFGLAPALHAARQGVGATLRLNARTVAGRGRRWGLKDGLIATQVALSLLLLVVGGLFVRTLRNLRGQDYGFSAANVLSVQIGAQGGYRPEWGAVIVPLLQRVQAIPGVQAATVSTNATIGDNGSGVSGLKVDGYVPPTADDQRARANWVGPGYFETSRIPLVEGRGFTAADNATAMRVAIVNQAMARHYFGDARAVGRRFEFNAQAYEIIGVARNAKYTDLRAPSPRFVYFAVLQGGGVNSLEVRTSALPLTLAGSVRAAVHEVDSRLRIGGVTTLAERVDRKLGVELLVADLTGFFGALTLLLVSVGVYGTVAYAVAGRTNEIGIRMALGARPASVLTVVLRDVLVVLAVGLAGGIAAAVVGGRLVASMLFGLSPADFATIALAGLVLSVTALVAGYIPARRASRVDPLTALRVD